jgi:hypothetical protein
MSEIENTVVTPEVTNLRDAKKEQTKARAAAKAVHPAGRAPAKAPAKKAPVKAAATKTPGKTPVLSGKPKLRWVKQHDGGLTASTDEGTYVIKKSGDKFAGVVKRGSKSTVIIDNVSAGRAYSILSRLYGYGEMPAGKKASA